jgi:hypothetical protein
MLGFMAAYDRVWYWIVLIRLSLRDRNYGPEPPIPTVDPARGWAQPLPDTQWITPLPFANEFSAERIKRILARAATAQNRKPETKRHLDGFSPG